MYMKKLIIVVTVTVLIGVLVFTFRNQQEKEQTVTSDDGNVKLTISSHALPKEVKSDSLKITKVPQEEKIHGKVVVYELEPDGIALTKPAKIEITVQNTDDGVPLITHRSGIKTLPLEDVVLTQNNQGKVTKITANLLHFSSIIVMPDVFRVSLSVPALVYVTKPFLITARVAGIRKPISFTLSSGTVVDDILLEPWLIEGSIEMDKTAWNTVQPQGLLDRPSLTKVQEGKSMISSGEFTCITPDQLLFAQYKARLSGEIKSVSTYSPEKAAEIGEKKSEEIEQFQHQVTVLSELFDCVDRVSPKPAAATSQPKRIDNGNLVPLDVLIIDNKFFPAMQFTVAGADTGCSTNHYHAKYEVSSIGLDTHRTDPSPTGCGFGTVDQVPRRTEMVPKEQAEVF